MNLVYRYRVKCLTGLLNQQARAVTFVWNYCNDRQKDALRFGRRWLKSRSQQKRPSLRYRGRKSLGWVPLKGRDIKETPNGFHFHGREFKVFKSRELPGGAKIKDGTAFSRDARGNWFLNVCIEVDAP